MAKKSRPKVSKYYKLIFIKEIIFTVLAVFSVFLLIYEYATSPPESTIQTFNRIEIMIALIFLTDFFLQMYFAKDKKAYFKRNWIYLLASIPLIDSWTEFLRVLRILGLIRLLRAGEHLKRSLNY